MSARQAFHPFLLAQRGTVALRALLAVFVLLALAFFRIQVLQHDKYRLKSESNRLRPVPLTAPRGLILDRRGRIIAENVPGYSVLMLASSADSLRARVERLAPFVTLDSEQLRRVMQRYRAAPYEPLSATEARRGRHATIVHQHVTVLDPTLPFNGGGVAVSRR